jgi:hypothetical protein
MATSTFIFCSQNVYSACSQSMPHVHILSLTKSAYIDTTTLRNILICFHLPSGPFQSGFQLKFCVHLSYLVYKPLIGKCEGMRSFGRHNNRWEDNTKTDHMKIGGKLQTEFIWLRKGASGRPSSTWHQILRFHKGLGISSMAELLIQYFSQCS